MSKVDSNITGLRYCEEETLKTLPSTKVWHLLEPNSYSDFGGQIGTVARDFLNPSRQQKKGVTTDVDAGGGFSQDLTYSGLTRLLQGFFFADIRERVTSRPMNSAGVAITAVAASDDSYSAASGLANVLAGNLVLATGFAVADNNGLKIAADASIATKITVTTALADETPGASGKVQVVGYQFASETLDVAMNGDLVRLARASGSVDFTTLGCIPGEWIYVGGDASGLRFTNNVGWARVRAITATYLELDKVSWTPQNETGTSKTVQIFFGNILKNEANPSLIKRRTYNLERTLGGTQGEYLVGAVPNEFALNVPQADKITCDLAFVACDTEALSTLKEGTRGLIPVEDAYNTSDDFARIKLAIADPVDATPSALFAYATEFNIALTNNVSPNKAIGIIGAFDTSAGNFTVSGSMTVYFATVDAIAAIRGNADVTIDVVIAKARKGIVIDIPLLSLGDGRLSVEKDSPITLPLELTAGESFFGHTLLMQFFDYLPEIAEA